VSRGLCILCCITLASGAAGCESASSREGRAAAMSYVSGNFGGAYKRLEKLAEEKDENYVLNNLRFGATAMVLGDVNTAERAYVRAHEELNATSVNDPSRSFAAAAFNESVKIWRGEPYERAVANLNLGLIYFQRGDWNNARGAFENALFKLRDYQDGGDEQFEIKESDFAVALLLLGKCHQQLNRPDEARRYFDQVVSLRRDLEGTVEAVRDPRVNVILYVEYGYGPRKIAGELNGAVVAFSPTPGEAGRVPAPVVNVNGQNFDGPDVPTFDTVAMAADRRWQSIDTIRATKSVIGTGLMVAGAGTTMYGAHRDNDGAALVGIGMILAGALVSASSEADTRQWEMVPRAGFVIPMILPPGEHDVAVSFPQTGLGQTRVKLVAPAGGQPLRTYWYRVTRTSPRVLDDRGPVRPTPLYDATAQPVNNSAQ
jgi:tetratricopeptide (TPR) repeat protein